MFNCMNGICQILFVIIGLVGSPVGSVLAVIVPEDTDRIREDRKLGFDPLPIDFGEMVGVVVHFNQGETLDHLLDLKALGVKWVRDEQSWSHVELVKGKYTWPENRIKRMNFYRENEIKVIFPLTYSANLNAYPNAPYDPVGFGAYAVAAAKYHQQFGIDVVLEIFNEPHNFGLMNHFGGPWQGSANCPWIDHYIKMANQAIIQTKAYDPNIKLITNEDVWTNHYWYLEGKLDKRLDGFAIHPYILGEGSSGPEIAHFGQDPNGWMKEWTIIDQDRSNRSLMRRLRAQYARKIGRPLDMYITEWGYPLNQFKGSPWEVTEELAAAFLPRVYIIGVAAGARVVCWHCSQDMGDGPFGLIGNNQEKRKTYYALKTMIEELKNYQLVKQISGLNMTTTGIQAYLFKGQEGYQLVAWNIEGDVEVRLNPASEMPCKIIDHFGRELNISSNSFKLSQAPLYIKGVGLNCSLSEK